MYYPLNKVSPTVTAVHDMRRGDFTQQNRPCLTPWGQFRSVQQAVDHAITREGEFATPFIIRAAWSVSFMDTAESDVIKKASKNIYQNIYKRCQVGTDTNNGQFRFI